MQISIPLIVLFQVSALIIREFARLKMADTGLDSATAKQLSALIGFAALSLLMWPLLRGQWMNVRSLFQRPQSWFHLITCSVAIGLLFRLANWTRMIASIAFGFQGSADSNLSAGPTFWWACPPGSYLLLSVVVMAGLTPLVEEIIHRGLILCSLLKKHRSAAVLLSAITFSALHAFDDIFLAFAFGMVAAIQMINYRSLWASLFTHMTFNFMITIDWDCLHGFWYPESSSPALGLIAAGLTIAFLAAAWVLAQNEKCRGPIRAPALNRAKH